MKRARDLVLRLHRWIGLAVGAVVAVVCLTGAAVLVTAAADQAADEALGREAPPGVTRLPISSLLEAALRTAPDAHPSGISLSTEAPRRVTINFYDHPVVWLDPWDGSVMAAPPPSVTGTLVQLHVGLMLGRPGEILVAVSTIALFGLTLLGLWLWWPTKRTLRRAFLIDLRRGFKRANYDIHNVLGFYSALLLLVLSGTGIFMAYPSVNNLGRRVMNRVFHAAPESPPVGTTNNVADSLPVSDRVWAQGRALFPGAEWQRIVFRQSDLSPTRVEVGVAGPEFSRRFHRVRVSPEGEVLTVVRFGEEAGSIRWARWIPEFHLGWVNTPYRVAAFVACLIGGILPISGTLVWYPRWRRRRRGVPDDDSAESG